MLSGRRMTEEQARRVELVRAIEAEDREAVLLTQEDRAQAEVRARSDSGHLTGSVAGQTFIASRAAFASTRLATRHPGISGLLRSSRWPRWIGIAVPILGLVAGFLSNEFGTGRRLDLLAVPLLGTIAWNLFVYLWVVATAFRRKQTEMFSAPIRWIRRLRHRDLDHGSALHRAASAFEQRWLSLSAPLTAARTARSLHLAAALFALGLIGGIYLRALVIEYYAGWESTFLNAQAVHALLSGILGPASTITGVVIPAVDGIAAMRWTGLETGGVNAGPWIHLYTVTVIGLVVIPRLLLAAWQGVKVLRMTRNFPIAGREDFYMRRLLHNASGIPGNARVTPYAYRPDEQTRRNLTEALRGALGDGAQVRFDEPIDYGAEDRWITMHSADPDADYHILLFTLSSTAEEENHGALATSLAGWIASEQPGTVLGALIDESPFRAHFAGQSGLQDRIASRLTAWRSALASSGITPLGVDLSTGDAEDLAQTIESGLLPDGAMYG